MNNPLHMVSKFFNKLPMEIKQSNDSKEIKSKVKTLLVEIEPYDVEEFTNLNL